MKEPLKEDKQHPWVVNLGGLLLKLQVSDGGTYRLGNVNSSIHTIYMLENKRVTLLQRINLPRWIYGALSLPQSLSSDSVSTCFIACR